MSYIQGIDVSHYQGVINWPAVRAAGVEIAIIKISGSDAGNYYDSKASTNYYGAKAAGIAVGGYHFAGGTDPTAEANYFVNGMKPFVQGDVFVLDWEVSSADPVSWCATFCQRVHDLTNVWPILYMNGSTANAHSWNSNSVIANCGKWIAWYGRDPNATLPVNEAYIMHQYNSSGAVNGITGRLDMDAWYGTIDQFERYGYQAPAPTPPPTPAPAPAPQPVITNTTDTKTVDVPFSSVTNNDPTIPIGQSSHIQQGVDGIESVVYSVTLTDGVETSRAVISDTITTAPLEDITVIGTMQPVPDPVENPTPEPVKTKNVFEILEDFINTLLSIFRKKK